MDPQLAVVRDEILELLTRRLSAVESDSVRLQRAARSLRQAESIDQWVEMAADGAQPFARRVAVFALESGQIVARALRGQGTLPEPVALELAPAFAQAVESRETTVCLTNAGQLSAAVAECFQPVWEKRAHLLPVVGRTRVVAVLYAEGAVNLPALEVLSALAAGSLELRPQAQAGPALILPVLSTPEPEHRHTPAPAPVAAEPAPPAARPGWEELPDADRGLHLRAQRFARLTVARLIADEPERAAEARTRHNLFAAFRVPLLEARAEYRQQFLSASDTMVDYLHLELLARLALDDETVLGMDYPGPLR